MTQQQQQQQQQQHEQQQEIIFRFTIPNDVSTACPMIPNLSKANFQGVPPSDSFTVCAFGEDYQVEYPSGIVGLRRPCANQLGYISLPAYYAAPVVKACGEKRYRVQVPPEIGPGDEFYASLPNSGKPPLQVRLVAPPEDQILRSSNHTFLEFETNHETPLCGGDVIAGILCHWKATEPPKTTMQVELPRQNPSMRITSSSSSPEITKDQARFFMTRIGAMPAVVTHPSLDCPANQNVGSSTSHTAGTSRITFSVPLRSLPALPPPARRSLNESRPSNKSSALLNMVVDPTRNHGIQAQGQRSSSSSSSFGEWHRLYHVSDDQLKWFYLVLPQLPQQQSRSDNSSSDNSRCPAPATTTTTTTTTRVLTKQAPLSFCCCLLRKSFGRTNTTNYTQLGFYNNNNNNRDQQSSLQNQENMPNHSPQAKSRDDGVLPFIYKQQQGQRQSSASPPPPPTKRSPWQLVPTLEAPGLSTVLRSRDRKTLRGTHQLIGTFWDLVALRSERKRQDCISSKWRVKLQGEGSTIVVRIRASTTTATTSSLDDNNDSKNNINEDDDEGRRLLDSVCQAIHEQLPSPRLLRGPWELEAPSSCFRLSSKNDWNQELAERLLRLELCPTPANAQRWEFHANSRLPCCHLLGMLVGKSLVEGNRPLFTEDIQLATYLYKHMLQWPIQQEDYLGVVGGTTSKSGTSVPAVNDDGEEEIGVSRKLKHRLFERSKNPISSFLDGVVTIVPQSFVFVFRSLEELEACLVADCTFHPSSLTSVAIPPRQQRM